MVRETIYDWIEATTGLGELDSRRLVATLLTILVIWLLRMLILRVAYARSDDVRVRYQWRKVTTYILVPIGFLIFARIWFGGGASMLTFLGLLSAGLAIALKDPVVNLAAWGFLLWRRPFVVGDRIQLGEFRGDVIDMRIFQFSLMEIGNWVDADQSTGRIVHVPNGLVFSQPLANYTQGLRFIWHEIPVVVTFESDWEKAHGILTDIANDKVMHLSHEAERRVREAAEKYLIFFSSLTPIVYTKVVDHGVALTMRFLCDPRRRRGSEDAIWRAILTEFAKHDDIDFAYPTQRFYDNRTEGKEGAGGPGNRRVVDDPGSRTPRE